MSDLRKAIQEKKNKKKTIGYITRRCTDSSIQNAFVPTTECSRICLSVTHTSVFLQAI